MTVGVAAGERSTLGTAPRSHRHGGQSALVAGNVPPASTRSSAKSPERLPDRSFGCRDTHSVKRGSYPVQNILAHLRSKLFAEQRALHEPLEDLAAF